MRKFTLFMMSLFLMLGTAMAQNYSLTETCISSGELNAKTAPTLIAIKNLSRTNNYYFVGNTGAAPYSAADFSDAAVFVWQPVEEGVAGSYYLMKLDGTYMQATSSKDFGTVDGAAVFTTTNPTTAGTGSAYFNGDGDSQGYIVDEALLVRFVNAAGTWINVQNGDNGTPTYNSGSGGWTVHHVYAVEEAAVEPEPEAPFEVVAVTPSEAVAELSTITVEFSEEIAGEQNLMAMETIYVGSTRNACNFTVEGKVLTITLWTPITAAGEYALYVPAGVGITRASNGEAVTVNGEIKFTVEEPAAEFEVVAVTPSEPVAELSTITVEFSEEIAGEQDIMDTMNYIYVGSRTNACNFTVDGKVLTITLWTPITAAGEYALYVPAGVGITRASNGEAVSVNGEIKFTVEEAVVEPETFTVTAALFPTVEGDVTEIKGIRVEAGQGLALAELPTGWTLTNEAGDEFEMNIQWLYDYETILIMVNPAITEAGTYTLTIPAGSLKTEDGKECEAAEFSWTIKDPYMPYNNGTRTRTDRLIKGITLTGASGENSYALTADEQTQDYTDATAVAVFKVEAGEELTITFDKIGEWIHQFVFIDFDGDGFTASIAEGSEWAPAEDLVAYSFYNNDSSDDNYGWNSVGTSITGNDRSTPAVPAFQAPETIGTYRMRVKQDWCNIDPAGDADGKFEDFKTNGGQIIDVILEVVEATTGIENVEAETVKAIYDITGRKIEKITEGGIYIVNGKKVLVK